MVELPGERGAAVLRLATTASARVDAYLQLFASDPRYWRTDEIRKATNGNLALGNERFKRELAALLGRRVEAGKAGRPSAKENVVRP